MTCEYFAGRTHNFFSCRASIKTKKRHNCIFFWLWVTRAAPTINRVWPKVKGIVRVTSTQNFEDFKGFSVLNPFSKTLIADIECITNHGIWYTVWFLLPCRLPRWDAFSRILCHLWIKPRQRLGDTLVYYDIIGLLKFYEKIQYSSRQNSLWQMPNVTLYW